MTSAKWPFKHGGGKRREKEKTEIVLNHQKRSSLSLLLLCAIRAWAM